MSTPHWTLLLRHSSLLGAVLFVAVGSACAQSDSTRNSSNTIAISSSESSSSSSNEFIADDGAGSNSDAALPSAPAASGAAAAGQGSGGRGIIHHLTFEAGGGANPPAGGNQQSYITWGGNFTLGAGYRFTDRVSALLEYQFIDDKLPGALIAETGANGGDAHIWSLSVDPVIDLLPKATNDLYVTGGGGFYRKVTNFTDPEETEYCSYYYCEPGVVNEVVGHFSSNQGGWSVGGGYIHRMGGMYGDSKTKLFAEVRYLEVMTPAETTEPNGLGQTTVAADTKLIPVTLGVRW
jgi:Outer membrane protein beta-barrel domain